MIDHDGTPLAREAPLMLNGPEPETVAIAFTGLFEFAFVDELEPVSALMMRVKAKRPARVRYTVCASATELYIGDC
jgi:hypothetical protein